LRAQATGTVKGVKNLAVGAADALNWVSGKLGGPTTDLSGYYEKPKDAIENAQANGTISTILSVAGGKSGPRPAVVPRGSVLTVNIGEKITKQMSIRGWQQVDVVSAVANPARSVVTRDTRYLPSGDRMNDPATAYYSKDGGYVVRNDITGDIVQVSNRNDQHWTAPWD
jgi:hypothetical protein